MFKLGILNGNHSFEIKRWDMEDKVKFIFEGKTYELQIVTGSEGEKASTFQTFAK